MSRIHRLVVSAVRQWRREQEHVGDGGLAGGLLTVGERPNGRDDGDGIDAVRGDGPDLSHAQSLHPAGTQPAPRAAVQGSDGKDPARSVVAPMPRRRQFPIRSEHFVPPPMRQVEVFEASVFRAVGRLWAWSTTLTAFFAQSWWDRLRGRDSSERRAVRLREICEHEGATFIKFGQQLSVRADIVPHVYSRELMKMLDRVPPFPTEEAIATIERTTGKPLGEIFSVFDPEPVGSASLACVYQAQLLTGERVAVKVRRPGIGRKFAADLRALDWLLILAEWLTIVRPGFTRNLRLDLRQTLFEELNFRREARYQDLFRRRARRKSTRRFFTAPRVFFELSNEEVITQEFASGVWLSELLEIVDRKDEAGLAYIARLNIDPKVIARRLHWVAMWGMLTDLFFHADPHPANVILRPNNEVVFIDFGSCGAYDQSRRVAMQQLFYHQQRDDIAGMVQASLHILEPLPPIDVTEFAKELQTTLRQQHYAMRSKQTVWWERTNSHIWIEMVALSRKYSIPMSADVLRMMRANFLYDTIAARLDNRIDPERVYRRFARDAGKQARKRVRKSIRRRLSGGLVPNDYMAVERTVDTAFRLMYRVHRFLDNPAVKLPYMVEKWVYAASILIRFAVLAGTLATAAVAAVAAARWLAGQDVNLPEAARQVARNGWLQLLLLFLALLNLRKVLVRLSDKTVSGSS